MHPETVAKYPLATEQVAHEEFPPGAVASHATQVVPLV